jgi:hypothetical protein
MDKLDAIRWTEQTIQNVLYCHCATKRHELIVPNSQLFGWESDLVSVTKSGVIFEFEIKISRSDFLADLKKQRAKHLVEGTRTAFWTDRVINVPRPNFFFYVCPPDLIKAIEVPDYAGLIYADRPAKSFALWNGLTTTVKPAKRLHKEKANDSQYKQLYRATTFRFWRERFARTVQFDRDINE